MAILIARTGNKKAAAAPLPSGPLAGPRRDHVRRKLFLLVLAVWVGSRAPLAAQNLAGELDVKAAFLYNFAKFVEWPAESFATPSSPLVIAVVGDEPFAAALDRTVAGKAVQGRPIVVKRSKPLDDPLSCHIPFISALERNSIPQLLEKVRGASILTVGEAEGFAQRGGIINLLVTDNKLVFEINDRSARASGLRISSKLLTLARTVWE